MARNSNRIEWEAIRQFYESHAIMMWPSSPESDFRFAVYLKITWENMVRRLSPVLAAAVLLSFLLSVLLALFAALTGRARNHAHFQAAANEAVGPLLWAMFAAYLLLGVAIPGYTLNGYTWRWAPLLVFPVTVAQALLVANAAALISASSLSSFWPFRRRSEVPLAAALLAAAAGVSLYQYGEHPNFVHTPATALSTTYKGHSFVSATTFPHMIAQYTGRWAYYSPLVFSGDERLDQTHNWNADRNRNRDYETPEYYLCQTLPYNRTIDCSEVANKMSALGHEVAERGPGYVVVKLSWKLPALDGETSGRKTAAEPR